MIEIIILLHELYKLNFIYSDMKFDNFAYKILDDDKINEEMENHYKCKNNFFGKNLYVHN
jgi:hypothetical protein